MGDQRHAHLSTAERTSLTTHCAHRASFMQIRASKTIQTPHLLWDDRIRETSAAAVQIWPDAFICVVHFVSTRNFVLAQAQRVKACMSLSPKTRHRIGQDNDEARGSNITSHGTHTLVELTTLGTSWYTNTHTMGRIRSICIGMRIGLYGRQANSVAYAALLAQGCPTKRSHYLHVPSSCRVSCDNNI